MQDEGGKKSAEFPGGQMSFLHLFRKSDSFSPSFSCRFPSFPRVFAYFFLAFCKKIEKRLAFSVPIVYTISTHTSVDVSGRFKEEPVDCKQMTLWRSPQDPLRRPKVQGEIASNSQAKGQSVNPLFCCQDGYGNGFFHASFSFDAAFAPSGQRRVFLLRFRQPQRTQPSYSLVPLPPLPSRDVLRRREIGLIDRA